jgi:hypothetical protein
MVLEILEMPIPIEFIYKTNFGFRLRYSTVFHLRKFRKTVKNQACSGQLLET